MSLQKSCLLALCLHNHLGALAARPKVFLQDKELRRQPPFSARYWTKMADASACNLDMSQICASRGKDYKAMLLETVKARNNGSSPVSSSSSSMLDAKRVSRALARTLESIRNMPVERRPDPSIWESLPVLMLIDGRDALAFQETWTDEDTELLRAMDPRPGGFAKGDLTSDSFKADLPSISTLNDLVGKHKSVAIVGSGPTMNGHNGAEIDKHDVVIRFNDHVGTTLSADHTGLKLDVHVMNQYIQLDDAFENAAEVPMDLEMEHLSQTYCQRWRQRAEGKKMITAVRPSVWCACPRLMDYTRGFLVYWLVGRLFDKVDLYGMGVHDGPSHSEAGYHDIWEKFVNFEHVTYAMLADEPDLTHLKVHG